MSEQTLKEKTAKGLFWGGINNGLQQLSSVIFGVVLARMLNADDYGLVGMLAIFTGIATTVINSGFSVALTNKKNATQKDYDAVFWFTFFAGLILYTVLFFSAPLIARFFGRPELTSLSRVLFISFFFVGISMVPYTVMHKRLMIKPQVKIEIVSLSISGISGVILALKGYSYWALAIQSVVHLSFSSIMLCLISPWRPTFNMSFQPLKEMLPFSIKLFITSIFAQINANIFSLLLGKFYNATQLGYYSQGYKWMGMGHSFIGNMINSVSQPVLVQVHEEKERQLSVLRKLIRFGAFISFPLMLGMAFIGKEFIQIMIGDKWFPSVPFLQLFCVWGAFGYLWTLYTNLIVTHGKSNIYMYLVIIIGILQTGVVVALSFYGIYLMAVGYIVLFFIGLLVWQYYVHKLIGLRWQDVLKDILPYMLVTFVSFFIAWIITLPIRNVYLLCLSKVAVSAVLYILIMKVSRSIIFMESLEFWVSKKNEFINRNKK